MTIKEKLGSTAYEELLAATLFNLGDTLPMQNLLYKLQNNQPVCMATLGGSITEGLSKMHWIQNTFVRLVHAFLAYNLYNTPKDIKLLNLGISSSYPLLGLCLVESHLRDFRPDLVIVEFAVNEALNQWGISRFESLIRNLLTLPNAPAFLILNSVNEANTSASSYMAHLGQYYHLPVINIGDGLIPAIQNHALCWSDYASDALHPHENGHQLIADCCIHYLKTIYHLGTKKSNTRPPLPSCCFHAPYEHLTFLDVHKLIKMSDSNFSLIPLIHPHFPTALTPSSPIICNEYYISFSLHCKILIILFLQDNTPSFATATVYIDEEETCALQGYAQFTMRYPAPQCVIDTSESLLHHVTLKLTGADASKAFYLLGIAYCN